MTAHLAPARFVTIERASELTGYSVRAIQTKIDRGIWAEGRQWVKAPDNRILIDMQGYETWVVNGHQGSSHAQAA